MKDSAVALNQPNQINTFPILQPSDLNRQIPSHVMTLHSSCFLLPPITWDYCLVELKGWSVNWYQHIRVDIVWDLCYPVTVVLAFMLSFPGPASKADLHMGHLISRSSFSYFVLTVGQKMGWLHFVVLSRWSLLSCIAYVQYMLLHVVILLLQY